LVCLAAAGARLGPKRARRLQSLKAIAIGGKTEKLGIGEAVVGIPAGAAEHPLIVVEASHQSLSAAAGAAICISSTLPMQ
jgi:hypothetical protein